MNRILLIEARFYSHINDLLLEGIEKALKDKDFEMDVLTVPGALEIPAALNIALQGPVSYDAFIVAGCVIRGETSHYDIVCNESARGIYDLTLKHNLALGNVILTVESQDQAIVRADPRQKDKGGAAVRAALRMLEIKKHYA